MFFCRGVIANHPRAISIIKHPKSKVSMIPFQKNLPESLKRMCKINKKKPIFQGQKSRWLKSVFLPSLVREGGPLAVDEVDVDHSKSEDMAQTVGTGVSTVR